MTASTVLIVTESVDVGTPTGSQLAALPHSLPGPTKVFDSALADAAVMSSAITVMSTASAEDAGGLPRRAPAPSAAVAVAASILGLLMVLDGSLCGGAPVNSSSGSS